MKGLVESVKDNGVHQPALVRPREGGGYEIIAGHRRQRASELAGFANMPCIQVLFYPAARGHRHVPQWKGKSAHPDRKLRGPDLGGA